MAHLLMRQNNDSGIQNLGLVFMGTPEFAVPSLEKLLNAGYEILAVVTAPDKPAGRGLKLQESEVKKFAAAKGLKILQPQKLKSPEFLEELRSLNASLNVVVAFRMLPEVVWNMPSMGTINLHASMLPKYRGAAPINWAIINGEKETGLTTFKLQHEIDTGNILLQEKIMIGEDETAGELHDRMKDMGADLVLQTVKGLSDGTIKATPQEKLSTAFLAPKISTETCKIAWNKSADEVYNLIRGLSPYPTAFTYLDEKILKIFKGRKEQRPISSPGEFETDQKTFLKFACNDGWINILELQMEGKKKMGVEEFLRGYRFGGNKK